MILPPLALGDFPAAFEATHGYPPFPWQTRLTALLSTTGVWPESLDLPTASGKTATLDVALFHLALEADRAVARKAPIRVAFVVDRRIIVDEAADRGDRMAAALVGASETSALGRMAIRLRHLSGEGSPPLLVRRLRGGVPREDDWARSPNQPTILCSTVDQVGSRLLFRGYGVSDTMVPVHAGLLGSDCLLLLDEAHLAVPFVQTLERVAAYRAPPWCEHPPGPWAVATLSATPHASRDGFTLADQDRQDPVLSRRLTAPKPALLRALNVSAKEMPEDHAVAFVDAVRELRQGDDVQKLAVVVNRAALARAIFQKLRNETNDGADIILLTGRIRGLDRDRLIAAYAPRLRSGAAREGAPLLVVATQPIEAGADFDFDGLVTQAAPLDALRQRFGRLNRMGRNAPAPAIILATKDEMSAKAYDPVYGDRMRKTWNWLLQKAGKPAKTRAEPIFDFGIDAADRAFATEVEAITALTSVKTDAPILRPADVMLLSWSAPVPAIDPAIWLFLHGPQAGMADVAIVWRADLKEDALDEAAEVLALVSPHIGEILAVPLWAVRAWLSGMEAEAAETADLEGIPAREAPQATRRNNPRRAFRWAGAESPKTGVIVPNALRPGDTIVVPATMADEMNLGGPQQIGRPFRILAISARNL